MEKDKFFSLDRIIIEFCLIFWNLMRFNYVVMIEESILKEATPSRSDVRAYCIDS